MQVKFVIFPSDEGLNVVMWGKWAQGSMRVRHFETRSEMIATLQDLRLITAEDAVNIEGLTFEESCPLFSGEVDEWSLADHGFEPPTVNRQAP
jgi:hypothetical protein